MFTAATQYGRLHGISYSEYYPDGVLKACILNEPNRMDTPWGVLVPQYEDSGFRRKSGNSVRFFHNGFIQRIALHNQTSIPTPIGMLSAELLTFYESGHLKRLFPLNGKLSAYWSEENEHELARELDFQLLFGSLKKKIIAIHFYETGAIKSLTFWPRDSLVIQTPLGEAEARIGISLYENGCLQSFEPYKPIKVHTPIGELKAFNHCASGIHGDSNSVVFNQDGSIHSLATCSNMVTVSDREDIKTSFTPIVKPWLLEDGSVNVIPLWIEFRGDLVRIGNNLKKEYEIGQHTFLINQLPEIERSCCSSCRACG